MNAVQEALKAAIEALEYHHLYIKQDKHAHKLCKSALSDIEKCEPVGWQFYQDGKWHNGMETNNHKENTIDAGIPVRDLYTSPQPIEKCEPVAWIIDHVPNTGQRQLVSSKLYADNEMKKGEECNSGLGKRYPYDVCTPLYALPKDKD